MAKPIANTMPSKRNPITMVFDIPIPSCWLFALGSSGSDSAFRAMPTLFLMPPDSPPWVPAEPPLPPVLPPPALPPPALPPPTLPPPPFAAITALAAFSTAPSIFLADSPPRLFKKSGRISSSAASVIGLSSSFSSSVYIQFPHHLATLNYAGVTIITIEIIASTMSTTHTQANRPVFFNSRA